MHKTKEPSAAFDESKAYRDTGLTPAEVAELAEARRDGRLQIIDKDLFCSRASKRDGKCAGYNENKYSHRTLEMCIQCEDFDPNCDSEEYFGDDDEEDYLTYAEAEAALRERGDK